MSEFKLFIPEKLKGKTLAEIFSIIDYIESYEGYWGWKIGLTTVLDDFEKHPEKYVELTTIPTNYGCLIFLGFKLNEKAVNYAKNFLSQEEWKEFKARVREEDPDVLYGVFKKEDDVCRKIALSYPDAIEAYDIEAFFIALGFKRSLTGDLEEDLRLVGDRLCRLIKLKEFHDTFTKSPLSNWFEDIQIQWTEIDYVEAKYVESHLQTNETDDEREILDSLLTFLEEELEEPEKEEGYRIILDRLYVEANITVRELEKQIDEAIKEIKPALSNVTTMYTYVL